MSQSQGYIHDLDVLVKPSGRAKLLGIEYDIMPVDGRCSKMLDEIARVNQLPPEQRAAARAALSIDDVYRAVIESCVVGFPMDQYDKLRTPQIVGVVGIATEQQTLVREMIEEKEKNADGP